MFTFLIYTRPTWYYRLVRQIPAPILIDYRKLEGSQGYSIQPDFNYLDSNSTLMDAAYQYLQSGYIPSPENSMAQNDIIIITSISDNYRFIRKYHSVYWYIYTLLIRLITLHNPFIEIWNFIRNFKVKQQHLNYSITNNFLIEKINKTTSQNIPLVSVIIPTLNRYNHLHNILLDLEDQDYKYFEVIICDQSDPFNKSFYKGWNLHLKVLQQKEKALWLARNECIKLAKGEFIALTEDDVRIQRDWLHNHLKCVYAFKADASCGIFYPEGSRPSLTQQIFKLSDQFPTGNTLLRKKIFNSVGLFDRQFEGQRMGDGEFGLRCLLAGFKLVQNPLAHCIDVKAPTGGLRQMGSWDALRPRGFLNPRPVPSVLYFIRKYFGKPTALLYITQQMPTAFIPYKWKNNKPIKILSVFAVPLLLPVIIYTFLTSWKRASIKLDEGSKIEYNI